MLPVFTGVLFLSLTVTCAAQDLFSWQSLSQLNNGDKVRLTPLRGKPVTGRLTSWTVEQVTAGTVTLRREDVRKIERFRSGGRGRGRRAGIWALAGFGGGFALGFGFGGGCSGSFGPCISRPVGGLLLGVVGAVVGGVAGAFASPRNRELIYVAK